LELQNEKICIVIIADAMTGVDVAGGELALQKELVSMLAADM
jgi:hypothetical protein